MNCLLASVNSVANCFLGPTASIFFITSIRPDRLVVAENHLLHLDPVKNV